MQYHSWAYTTDPSPVLDAQLSEDYDGAVIDWDAVQSRINTTIVHWETSISTIMAVVNVTLEKGPVYYAAVRSLNRANLWTPIAVSDGVVVGKSEIKPQPNASTSVGFDSVRSADGYASSEAQRDAESKTLGSLQLPAGALPDETEDQPPAASILAGVVDENDVAGNNGDFGETVNASTTQPPARNFAFGKWLACWASQSKRACSNGAAPCVCGLTRLRMTT